MQRDTFAHDEFASVVIECVRSATASSAIEQRCRMIFICCNGGGPSTCIANIAAAVLNDMKLFPAGDVAAFECEHWCLHRTLLLDIGQTLIGIARWVYTPESGRDVAVAAAGTSGPLSLGYNGYLGYDAAMIVGTDGPSTLESGLVGYNRKSMIVHRNLSWCNNFAQNARAIVSSDGTIVSHFGSLSSHGRLRITTNVAEWIRRAEDYHLAFGWDDPLTDEGLSPDDRDGCPGPMALPAEGRSYTSGQAVAGDRTRWPTYLGDVLDADEDPDPSEEVILNEPVVYAPSPVDTLNFASPPAAARVGNYVPAVDEPGVAGEDMAEKQRPSFTWAHGAKRLAIDLTGLAKPTPPSPPHPPLIVQGARSTPPLLFDSRPPSPHPPLLVHEPRPTPPLIVVDRMTSPPPPPTIEVPPPPPSQPPTIEVQIVRKVPPPPRSQPPPLSFRISKMPPLPSIAEVEPAVVPKSAIEPPVEFKAAPVMNLPTRQSNLPTLQLTFCHPKPPPLLPIMDMQPPPPPNIACAYRPPVLSLGDMGPPPPPNMAYRPPDVGRHAVSKIAAPTKAPPPPRTGWQWPQLDAPGLSRPSILHWVPALKFQWHVDDAAVTRLVRLSVECIEGYQGAIAIIIKLVKAVCDDRRLRNRSAFVNKCVTNAWTSMGRSAPDVRRR